MGINTMVTGDNPIAAAAIAARQPSMSLATGCIIVFIAFSAFVAAACLM
jgi:hypothetical protein